MNELKKLEELLKEYPLIKQFKILEKAINENDYFKDSLNELFHLQQEMVQLKYLEKFKMYEIVEKQYYQKRKELENNPLVVNFLELQEEVNNLLKTLKSIIENELKVLK